MAVLLFFDNLKEIPPEVVESLDMMNKVVKTFIKRHKLEENNTVEKGLKQKS